MRLSALLLLLFPGLAQAITYVGSTSSFAAEAASRTPEEPVGAQEGDLLLGVCSTSTVDDGDWTIPMGFTSITEIAGAAGTQRDVVLAYAIRGSSAGTYTFSYDGTAGPMRCVMAAFRDVDGSTPFDVTYSEEDHYLSTNNSANDAPKAITTVTDGAWVLVIQVRVGDAADSTAAPSGYTERVDLFGVNPEVSIASKEVASAGTETPGEWGHVGVSFADTSIFTLALRAAADEAEFTSGPSVSAATNGYTVSGTLTGDGTLTAYAVACLPSAADASAAQVKAGDCEGDADAEIAASEVWSSGVADSFGLAKTGAYVRHKVCVVGSDGSSDTAVTCSTVNRSADADQTIVTLASVSGTSPFSVQSDSTGDTTEDSAEITGMTSTSFLQAGMRVDVSAGFDCSPCIVEEVTPTSVTLEEPASSSESNVTVSLDVYFDPDVATGDVVEYDEETSHGDAVTWGVDGNISYPDTSGGQYTTVGYCIQDVSGSGAFSVPDCWSQDDVLHFFSTRPTFDPDLGQEPILIYQGDETTIPFPCFDVDGQGVTVTSRESVPSGMSLVSNQLTGTAEAEDEAGTELTLDCADDGFLFATPTIVTLYISDDEVTMPDLTDGDLTDAISDMQTARPWLSDTGVVATFQCDTNDGDVIGQTPAAASTITATESVSVVVGMSSLCRRGRMLRLGGF